MDLTLPGALERPEPTQVVVLRCAGGYVGKVINQRWLEVPCRQRRCTAVGVHTHRFDMLTGRESVIVATVDPDAAERDDREPTGGSYAG